MERSDRIRKPGLLTRLAGTGSIYLRELKDSFTDGGSLLIFIIAAILYPMVYSAGYITETIKDVPVALVDLDHSALSRQFGRMLDAQEQLAVKYRPGSLTEAKTLFFDGQVHGVVLIPSGFGKRILRAEQGAVTVYCDASRFFVYKQVYTGAATAASVLNAGLEVHSLLTQGAVYEQALDKTEGLNPVTFDLYNPSSGYATFIVPGILMVVIQQSLLVGIGLLFGKYNERKKPLAGPSGIFPEILGRSTAYVTIYLSTSLVTLIIFYHWMGFPDKGSLLSVYLLLIPFLYSVSFLGIAVGTWFRKRVQSLMFIVFLSPVIFFLCGVAWPLEALPQPLHWVGYIFPTTPMLPAFLKIRVMGAGLPAVAKELQLIWIQAGFYLTAAILSMKIAAMRETSKTYPG